MEFDHPLNTVLGSKGSIAVLRALAALPPGLSVSARDLARRASLSHPTVLSVLDVLHDHGMVTVRREPKRDAYGMNREHVLSRKVIELFEWEAGLLTQLETFLTSEIKRRFPRTRLAILFGSIAEGRGSATSDVDLFLLTTKGPDLEEAVTELDEAVRMRFGNRAAVIVEDLPRGEFLRRASRNRLWDRILKTGIPLIGRA